MISFARKQYQYVLESRKVLHDYCRTIAQRDYISQHPSFGRGGSIRNLLVHVANTYEFWIATHALKRSIHFSEFEMNKNIEDVVRLYEEIDLFMYEFMENFDDETGIQIDGIQEPVEALKLFSHVITHEYHHKGQILSLSRQLGYTPVDTDIIR